ncbi:carboxylesterase family protein [Sphingomonas lenta]|uniref:Carboxylesterase type B domain-containing protein n=1 Tax=Sphingomonas lenta TaxID=1141887 RepID=A0A2A2SB58_9SPHN|nr:carboxylesterase family protein [Sphingomonas lenta]PAX06420.1 hypothetical protein CKY28_17665 [Sphingomonas lenta]
MLGGVFNSGLLAAPEARDATFDYQVAAPEVVDHGEELPLVFESLDRVPPLRAIATDRDRAVARVANACWINFARTGDPAGGECPAWPRYGFRQDRLMRFDVTSAAQAVPGAPLLDAFVRDGALGQQ